MLTQRLGSNDIMRILSLTAIFLLLSMASACSGGVETSPPADDNAELSGAESTSESEEGSAPAELPSEVEEVSEGVADEPGGDEVEAQPLPELGATTWAGMVNLDTQQGGLTLVLGDAEGGETLCEISQSIIELGQPQTPCPECDFSWRLIFGEAELVSGDPEVCLALAMEWLDVGHTAPQTLFFSGEDALWIAQGSSSVDGNIWLFNMSYESSEEGSVVGGDDGKDDDGKDDDGKDDDGKDDDGKDDDGKDDAEDFPETPCADDFDATQPCVGDAFTTACVFEGEWYWCDNGVWTNK